MRRLLCRIPFFSLAVLFAFGCFAADRFDRFPPWDAAFLVSMNRSDASDRSFYNATGTLNGNAAASSRSLVLDGTGDYAEWPDHAAYRAYPITYMTWFNMQSRDQTNPATLFGKYAAAGSGNGWLIYTDTAEVIRSFYGLNVGNIVSDSALVSPSSYKDSNWHHVAIVIYASGGIMYIDGASVDTAAWTGTPQATTTAEVLRAGRFGTGNYFNGDLDDLMIFSRELSAAEIAAIYAEGRP